MSGEMQQKTNGAAAAGGGRKGLVERFAERLHVEPNKLLGTLKNTVFQQRDGSAPSNEQMLALLAVADQYGLNPLTKELYAFPDDKGGIVPVVSVDGWSRIINGHTDTDGIEFRFADERVDLEGLERPMPEWCECVIYHKGRSHPTAVREYMDEVYRPPFVTRAGKNVRGPWQSHPRRMLRHKAFIQAGRVAYGFGGIFDSDEAERVIEARREEDGAWSANGGGAGRQESKGGVNGLRGRLGAAPPDEPADSEGPEEDPAPTVSDYGEPAGDDASADSAGVLGDSADPLDSDEEGR